MAAKLRPPKSYHDPCRLMLNDWLKPAAVSFSAVLGGGPWRGGRLWLGHAAKPCARFPQAGGTVADTDVACLAMGGAMRKALIFGLLSIGLTGAVLVGGSNRAECAGDDCPPYNSECSPYGLGNDCKSKSPFTKCGMQCVQVKEGYQTTHRCR